MGFSLDQALGVHHHAMRLRAQRTEVLASNIANADTPGYKARDIDFKAALSSAMDGSGSHAGLKTTHKGHIQGGGGSASAMDDFLRYRVPQQPALDGNTVETQVEQAAFGRNAVEYQASLKFLEGKFSGLTKAIKGGE